jgi:hypothetical protein
VRTAVSHVSRLCSLLIALGAACSGSDEDTAGHDAGGEDLLDGGAITLPQDAATDTSAGETDTLDSSTPDSSTSDAATDGSVESDANLPAPSIALLGAAELVLGCGEAFVDPGASATDAQGAPLDVEAMRPDMFSTTAPGTFQVRYRATDAQGGQAELTRTVIVCGPACGELGKQPVALAEFEVVQHTHSASQGVASWVVAQDGLSVNQNNNSDASMFLSNFDAQDLAVEGRWRMANSGDDDLVGFVFGYQDRGHFYLFDWKRGTQAYGNGSNAEAGMSLKLVSASAPDAGIDTLQFSVDDLWNTQGGPNVKLMERDGVPFHNTTPWDFNTDYTFFLEFHAGSFRIEVRDEEGVVLASWSVEDDTYESGRFGFYNFSQGPVNYRSFTSRETPSACSSVSTDAGVPDAK